MAGQQILQTSELQFEKFPTPSAFLYWKRRFKTQESFCSDFPSDAMSWIKKVEMVYSVDELKSLRSIAGKDFPNFELLDARKASALNKIIQNSHFRRKKSVWRNRKAQKEDRFLRRRQIALIYDYFRVTGAHDTVLLDTNLFSITLRNERCSGLRNEMG